MDLVEIGYVSRAHGIRGELRIVLHNPASTVLEDAARLFIDGTGYELRRVRAVKDAHLVELAGVGDRNRADSLRGKAVSVEREQLGLEEDELLLADFVGLRVELADGGSWGEVVGVETGPQDRLVIHDGDIERLLPVVDAFIVEVDLDAGRVLVAPADGWPETLIEGRARN